MITISNLNFGYKKKELLFEQLNLELKPGNIYGLFGMNGAGKTTLLKHLAGTLFPDKGICKINGIDVGKRLPEVLSEIFFIPEEFSLPNLKISTFVEINSPLYPRFDKSLLNKYLQEFDITDDKKLSTLSYGQKKKFLIAFGLATQAKVLLMDEPTNGLDIPSKSQFRRIIASVSTHKCCIVISTHQVRDLAALINHVTILDNGRIIFHQNIMDISQKLSFVKIKEESEANVLYAENILGGKSAIVPNKGFDTAIDLELLFNGVIKDHITLNKVLAD